MCRRGGAGPGGAGAPERAWYGLVAKIPRSRRWRVTAFGHRVMGAPRSDSGSLHFPAFYAEAA
jgi:hypothetical protein